MDETAQDFLLAYLFSVFLTELMSADAVEGEEGSEELDQDTVDSLQFAYYRGAYDTLNAILFGVDGFDTSITAIQAETEEFLEIEYEDEESEDEGEGTFSINLSNETTH